MAKELFAKRKAKFVESISKTSSISLSTQIYPADPPTFLLASTVYPPESSSSSSNHSETNSEIIIPAQQDKEYGVQLDDEPDHDELRSARTYDADVDEDDEFGFDPNPQPKSIDLLTAQHF